MIRFRSFLILGAVAGLAACQPAIPDSNPDEFVNPGRGVGFDNPNTLAAREARDAQLTGPVVQPAPAVGAQTLPPSTAGQASGAAGRPVQGQTPRAVSNPASLDAELAQIAAENDAAAAQANSGRAVVNASPSNAAPVILNNPGISDENDFDAVSSRQSIESDAARLEANRQQYQVVQPTALPSRAESAQPNVVQYALQTRHPKGTQVHRRFGVGSAARFERNCAAYNSADEAQIDFLARGGPERDRQGLDPDGDGYACAWDPAPFRRAAGN
ncbi:excalibur calcium-binding domain-containing protein [Tateyamaria sp. syn59]|uniref:excalibur calcium-binding domain-containing protein n=1 Tax=Tateyamaria sp. syn59 TaxID=2576942 RepID=UPI0011BDC5D8|nr:excalibur calcium-binding domain-containing protein [Tateyamaria sp. syn59]